MGRRESVFRSLFMDPIRESSWVISKEGFSAKEHYRGRQLLQGRYSVCFFHFPNLVPASLMLACLSPWRDSHNFISRNRDGVPDPHITASLHGRKFSMGTMNKPHKGRRDHCSLGLCLRVLGSSNNSMHFDSQLTVCL